jgi:hypothetical protein
MAEPAKTPPRSAKRTRCAIYTRKSSEDGLEQAFNSLDAQREACAAFGMSPRHEGCSLSYGTGLPPQAAAANYFLCRAGVFPLLF